MKRVALEILPEWETCCAEPHLDEISMLRDHLAWREREVVRLRDQINIAAAKERQREKDVYAAAKRSAWDHVLFCLKVYVLADAKRWIYDLARHALTTPPTKGMDRERWISTLQWNARQVQEEIARLDEPLADGLAAELKRFRDGLHQACADLHLKHGTNSGERCGCPGCETSRTVYGYTLPTAGEVSS